MSEQSKHNEVTESTDSSLHREKNITLTLIEYGKTIFITLLVALVLKLFVVEAYRIPSTSMENTLQVGEFFVGEQISIWPPHTAPYSIYIDLTFFIYSPLISWCTSGDVVVFEFPGGRDEVKPSESVNYIKRCIGLPGDTVEIRFGKVLVNGIETSFPLHGRSTIHQSDNAFRRKQNCFQKVRHSAILIMDGCSSKTR